MEVTNEAVKYAIITTVDYNLNINQCEFLYKNGCL